MPGIVFAEPEMPVIEHFKVGLLQFQTFSCVLFLTDK